MQALTLGPFAVDQDGTLQPREPGLRPAVRFAWRGRHCEAALCGEAVQLAAFAGRIPSTAEAGADRPLAFEALAALPGSLPPGWQARLLPDHRIMLESSAPLPEPPTATSWSPPWSASPWRWTPTWTGWIPPAGHRASHRRAR